MSAETYQVRITNTGTTIACRSDQTVLQACMKAGLDVPFACASGNCGACVAQLDAGTVSLLPRADSALPAAAQAAGKTLVCRAQPRSDLTVTLARSAGR